jgi:hypothetical protein
VLARLLEPVRAAGWGTALWALDDPDPVFEAETAGCGPGTKFELVNRLLVERPPHDAQYVVVSDDDALFTRGSIVHFLDIAARAAVDLAQPAHALRSNISHRLTWARPLSIARLTTFVEIGPIFAVSPAWRDRIVPFPDGIGMGWGLDVAWADLRLEGCRLGIVDATRIRHLTPFAAAYAPDEEVARMNRLLEERGAPGWRGLRRTLATWRLWRRRPPWLQSSRS